MKLKDLKGDGRFVLLNEARACTESSTLCIFQLLMNVGDVPPPPSGWVYVIHNQVLQFKREDAEVVPCY